MHVLPLIIAAFLPGGSSAESFVLPVGNEQVVFIPSGKLALGSIGGPPVGLAFFVESAGQPFRRLDGGRIISGPDLDADGWIRQRGEWVPGLRYELCIEPTPSGAVARLEMEGAAASDLADGLKCRVHLDRAAFEGHRVHALPEVHARVGTPFEVNCDSLLIELEGGRALVVVTEGLCALRSRGEGSRQSFDLSLVPRGSGGKLKTALAIAFTPAPDRSPGEILPARKALRIAGVSPARGTVGLYDKLELNVDLRAAWDNPYDPDDVALDAIVTCASGHEYRQPGFFMVDHTREVRGGLEVMRPRGAGRWVVRLAATELGPMHCRLVARDRSGTCRQDVGPFDVLPGASRGFVRRSRHDPHYLQFDAGAGFFPIGHNLPIYHTSGQLPHAALRKMAAAGENYNRWWMSRAGLGIEWGPRLTWYRQAQAARLDGLLDLGLAFMLCLDVNQDYRGDGWQVNPYNRINGGPCATVSDWFTGEAARGAYRKRLRYIVARWGYSPNILCWEFGNEFEGWADAAENVKIAWHSDMAAYLAALDPYDHLITTSWSGKTGPEECWRISDLGIVQTHCYTNNDEGVGQQVRDYCRHQWSKFDKPHIFSEFGIRSRPVAGALDSLGWSLHNAYWAGVCSGCCGTPMSWWHETYIEPHDLYRHLTAIAEFTRDLPFGTARWEPVAVAGVEFVDPPSPVAEDIVITPADVWGRAADGIFRLHPDGSIDPPGGLHSRLHGRGHDDLRNPPTFIVGYPRPGDCRVHVGRVSNTGRLMIWLDDELRLDREFSCRADSGREAEFKARWQVWECLYDQEIAIAVPAGEHRIRIENRGRDWMEITRYVFSGCRTITRPNLLVAALRAPEVAIVWIHNRESTWFKHAAAARIDPVPPARVMLAGFADGSYLAEWWDTWRGVPRNSTRLTARDGVLVLDVGEIATDRALKIRRMP